MPGKRNDELITNLNGEFQYRYEPNFAISQSLSQHMNIHGLLAYYPLTIMNATPSYVDISNQGRVLSRNGNVYIAEWAATQQHIGCAYFAGAQYLFRNDTAFDVVGNETIWTANYRGLTLGCWAMFDNVAAANEMLIAKYDDPNQRAYALYRLATGELRFNVSTNGVASVVATTATQYGAGEPLHIVTRFDPSTELAIFVNGVMEAQAVAGIPATLWASTANFTLGISYAAGIAADFFTGRMRDAFVSANYLEDVYIKMLYQQTRAMFGA